MSRKLRLFIHLRGATVPESLYPISRIEGTPRGDGGRSRASGREEPPQDVVVVDKDARTRMNADCEGG